MAKRGLALFDFDGTLVRGDSFRHFIRYMVGNAAMLRGAAALAPWLTGYAAGWISNHRAKEKVVSWFFKGMEAGAFDEKAARFAAKVLPSLEIAEAMEAVARHRRENHRLIVVSASFENYLIPWAAPHDLEVLGTCLEIRDGRLTGRFATPNCHGEEKVRRIREHLSLDDHQPIYAYGDTPGDYPMLALADEALYKVF